MRVSLARLCLAPVREVPEEYAHWEAGAPDLRDLQSAVVLKLLRHQLPVEHVRHLLAVGFDAPENI